MKLATMLLAMLLCSACFAQNGLAVPSAREQVQMTVDQVIGTLRDKDLHGEARRARLSKQIRARFAFAIMSQLTLGKYWKLGTPAQQERFAQLFADLLEASYIERIEAYSDETVEYVGEQIKGDRAEVTTRVLSASTEVKIIYRLVLRGEKWFVFDVVIEDVSLIKNYRSSYGEIIRNEGFDGLFSRMEGKIKELQSAAKG